MLSTSTWIARLTLFAVMLVHGITKLTDSDEFIQKFQLSFTLTALTATAELLACLGLIAPSLLPNRYKPLYFDLTVSALAALAIAIVQVGAIVMAKDLTSWFYFANGVEINVLILALTAIVVTGSIPRNTRLKVAHDNN